MPPCRVDYTERQKSLEAEEELTLQKCKMKLQENSVVKIKDSNLYIVYNICKSSSPRGLLLCFFLLNYILNNPAQQAEGLPGKTVKNSCRFNNQNQRRARRHNALYKKLQPAINAAWKI